MQIKCSPVKVICKVVVQQLFVVVLYAIGFCSLRSILSQPALLRKRLLIPCCVLLQSCNTTLLLPELFASPLLWRGLRSTGSWAGSAPAVNRTRPILHLCSRA